MLTLRHSYLLILISSFLLACSGSYESVSNNEGSLGQLSETSPQEELDQYQTDSDIAEELNTPEESETPNNPPPNEEPTPMPEPKPEPKPVPQPTPIPNSNPDVKTSDLGWKAGENVTAKLSQLLGSLKSGEELQLSHLYKINHSSIEIPEGVTISALSGAGFQITGAADSKGKDYIEVGNNTTFLNVTFTDDEATASQQKVMDTNGAVVSGSNVKNVKFINCKFDANKKSYINLNQVDGLLIKGTHFDKAYYQVLINSPSKNIEVIDSLFSNSHGDGIKTSRSTGNWVSDTIVFNTVFENNKRDGIDLTGGFKDSLVEKCIFRNLGVAGLDIKSAWLEKEDYSDRGNVNITIRDSEFIDTNSGIVLTTNDYPQLLTNTTAHPIMPREIYLQNIIVESNDSTGRKLVFSKDAHHVYWDNVLLLGKVTETRVYGIKDPNVDNITRNRPNLTKTNFELVGTNIKTGPPRGKNSYYPWSAVGPR